MHNDIDREIVVSIVDYGRGIVMSTKLASHYLQQNLSKNVQGWALRLWKALVMVWRFTPFLIGGQQ